MGNRLAGKVALITGSTSGIGRASAERFAEEGAMVIINGRRCELGMEVARGIRERGGQAEYLNADVSDPAQVRSLVELAADTYGRLDILMSNAYSGRSASVTELSEEDWDYAFAVTVKAAAVAAKHAIPKMIEAGGGSIILTSSVQGYLAGPHSATYNALKAALINLARQMAVDYGRYNIRVNALCPGRIVTEAKVEMLEANPEEVRRQQLVYPLGRPGTLREAADCALFLASDESSFVTGHALVVDGGLTAQLQDATGRYVDAWWMERFQANPSL
ncbi:MAG: glucose 1-dehydrogenase [Chloroflexi bacterium]|nr:glucose 1-dehydrogenase [Chloroflexota bacterium]